MDKVFPRILSLGRIEPENHRFFLVFNYCAVLGFLIHALLVPIFAWLGVGVMASLNVASVMLWASALFLNRHGKHTLAIALAATEVLLHSTLAVAEVGLLTGFHYYLFAAPPIIFFSPLSPRIKALVLMMAGGGLVGLHILGSLTNPAHALSPDVIATLSNVNLATAFIVLAALNYYYHRIAVRAESALLRTNDELARNASTDPLTGLINRRKMMEELSSEVERFMRNYRPFAILIADLDNFKSVNDRYGHEAGDYVLRQFAQLVPDVIRQVDRAARWGGEEFLFMLPETESAGATRVAERIREAVATHPFTYEGERLTLSLTVGVAVFEAGEAVDRCILRADHALYRGKQQGKNRVITA